MISLASALATIAALLLGWWLRHDPERKKEYRDEEIQKGRADLHNDRADAVSLRVDSLTPADCPGDAGEPGDEGRGGDSRTLDRLAALGIGNGPPAGDGGGLLGPGAEQGKR